MGRLRKKSEEVAEQPPAEQAPEEAAVAEAEPALDEDATSVEEETPAEEPLPAAEPKAAPTKAPPKEKAPRKARAPKKKPAPKRSAERKPIVRLPKPERARGRRKERRGVVVSSAVDKAIVVRVDTVKPHPRYEKVVKRSTKFHAHDEENVAKVGDVVRIVETRPLSKTKHWRLAEVLEAAR